MALLHRSSMSSNFLVFYTSSGISSTLAALKSPPHTQRNIHTQTHSHTHTHTHTYIYIYIYLIEHNRHFLSTYFFVNPFKLPYWSCDIWRKLVDKSSIISYFPSTCNPTLGHHQVRMYYKSDVTWAERDSVICYYLKIPKDFVCLLFPDSRLHLYYLFLWSNSNF